jgi:hypothetical protein
LIIGSKEVPIQNRFTLINGKFKKNLLTKFKNEFFLEVSQKLNTINMENFIKLLQEEIEDSRDLLNATKILEFLNKYRKTLNNNINLSSQYNEMAKNLILILRYNALLKEKEDLSRELELSIQYKKVSDIAASTDLLNKLYQSSALNKKKLKLFEEDYFQREKQIEQIKETLNEYDSKIKQLTNEKKQCFSRINRITLEMAGDTHESKNDIKINIIDSSNNLSNAEKIQSLQKKAKEIQYEINSITSKKNQTQLKLKGLTPIYETLKSDYQSLLNIINSDETRIKNLQSKLKTSLIDSEISEIQDIDLKTLRSLNEIENDIIKIDDELSKCIFPQDYFNPQNPTNLSLITRKLSEFDKMVKNDESNLIINIKEKEISDSFEQFKNLERSLTDIEDLINKFLSKINIQSQFSIITSKDITNFFVGLEFIRDNKENVKFEELTTPEKIFFILVFYISIKLYSKTEFIIFSNVSVLSKYNKAGSIYRTIRKILPVFKTDPTLLKFNLVFVISNLELKKDIKNLEIITIEES